MQRTVKFKSESYSTNINELLNKIFLILFFVSLFLFLFFEFVGPYYSLFYSLLFLYIFEFLLFVHFYMKVPYLLKEYFVIDDKSYGPLFRKYCRFSFLFIGFLLFLLQDDNNTELLDDFDFFEE